jgi:hypothetical protein
MQDPGGGKLTTLGVLGLFVFSCNELGEHQRHVFDQGNLRMIARAQLIQEGGTAETGLPDQRMLS